MFNLSAVMSSPANFARDQANLKVGDIIAEMIAKVNAGPSKRHELTTLQPQRWCRSASATTYPVSYSLTLRPLAHMRSTIPRPWCCGCTYAPAIEQMIPIQNYYDDDHLLTQFLSLEFDMWA
jgi:hypothetical protein